MSGLWVLQLPRMITKPHLKRRWSTGLAVLVKVSWVALTDTFGTPVFLRAFSKPAMNGSSGRSYAEVFGGVRQDSGDPEEYIKLMRDYYDKIGIKDKTIIFSDSLTVDRCKKYKSLAASYGFTSSFGIGTHLTSTIDPC